MIDKSQTMTLSPITEWSGLIFLCSPLQFVKKRNDGLNDVWNSKYRPMNDYSMALHIHVEIGYIHVLRLNDNIQSLGNEENISIDSNYVVYYCLVIFLRRKSKHGTCLQILYRLAEYPATDSCIQMVNMEHSTTSCQSKWHQMVFGWHLVREW